MLNYNVKPALTLQSIKVLMFQIFAIIFLLVSFLFLALSHYYRGMIIIFNFIYFFTGSLGFIFISISEQYKLSGEPGFRKYFKQIFLYLLFGLLGFIFTITLIIFFDFGLVFEGFILVVSWLLAIISVLYLPIKQKALYNDNHIGGNRLAGFMGMYLNFTFLPMVSFAPFIMKIIVVICLFVGLYSIILFVFGRGPWLAIIFASILTLIFAFIWVYTWQETKRKALYISILDGDLPKIKKLISQGYNVNAIDSSLGSTLHAAIKFGYRPRGGPYVYTKLFRKPKIEREKIILEILDLLLKNGANINATDGQSNTALLLAVKENLPIVVEWLISKGADINNRNKLGDTPLKLAIMNDQKEIEEYLRQHGAKE